MTADEICKIIEVSRACGVRHFSLGDLKFELRDTQGPRNKDHLSGTEIPTVEPLAPEEIKKLEDEQLILDNKSVREAQLDQLMVLDPELYEQLYTAGELVDVEENDDPGTQRNIRESE